jgi:hypothetical protein
MPKELPQFYMFPHSHGNISFLPNEKKVRKYKESYLSKGRFRNTLRLTPLSAPPLGEHTHTRTSPTS